MVHRSTLLIRGPVQLVVYRLQLHLLILVHVVVAGASAYDLLRHPFPNVRRFLGEGLDGLVILAGES